MTHTKTVKSHMRAESLNNREKATRLQMSAGMADANAVAFDKNGKYLYFTASTNVGPARGSLMSTIGRSSSSSAYLVVLSADDESPLGPGSDEGKGEVDRGAEMKKASAEAKKSPPTV